MVIEFAATTIVGRNRVHNEDAWGADSRGRVFAVADGMGGNASGAWAAKTAVNTILELAEREEGSTDSEWREPLASAIVAANARIHEEANGSDPLKRGSGATLAAIRFAHRSLTTAWVGDVRAYEYSRGHAPAAHVDARGGRLRRLTIDHLLTTELENEGWSIDDVADLPRKIVTQALGITEVVTVDVRYTPFAQGNLYLLATDGLSDQLRPSEIRDVVGDDGMSLDERCRALVEAADGVHGADNVTVVLVRVT